MRVMSEQTLLRVFRSTIFQSVCLALLAVFVGNINALIDSVLHPEIPYFDREHVIVGGVTALVSAALSFLLLRYARHIIRAEDIIKRLEARLPICSNCKKIRRSGADPYAMESWQPIESYITEKTSTKFSHGICPECMVALYPEYVRELQSE